MPVSITSKFSRFLPWRVGFCCWFAATQSVPSAGFSNGLRAATIASGPDTPSWNGKVNAVRAAGEGGEG